MTDWVRWGFDLGSSGLNTAETGSGVGNNITTALIGSMTLLFQTSVLDGKIQSQVVVVGAYAYVTTRGGTFYKLNATTGAVVASFSIGSPSSSTPHIVLGIAYFGADNGYLYAVNTTTMAQVWRSATQAGGAVKTHPVVVGSGVGLKVCYGADDGYVRAVVLSTGVQSWATSVQVGATGTASGALAYWDGDVFVAGGAGVTRLLIANGTPVRLYPSRNQAVSVAIQADGGGQKYLCFESWDHWVYAYDVDTGDRIWIEGHQGGDMKSPVGMDLANDYVIVGTHNWSIQPHHYQTGTLQWKRDGTASSAIVAGFALANGTFFGVWPPSVSGGNGDGRLVGWPTDQSPGGHTPTFKFGTFTGLGQGPDSRNKGNLCTPTIVNHRVYWGADDKIVYCFS